MTLSTRLIVAMALAAIVADSNRAFSMQSDSCTKDQYRPRYHFSPAANWINDPNGMVYYDGLYHLFYQYHPHSMEWGPMHWGHAVSSNLVTWKELDVALEPDDNGDIFSGSCVIDTMNTTGFKAVDNIDPIVAIYTSASGEKYEIQRQSLAYSLDKGMTFKKYEKNPVLKGESKDFRDPKVFFHNSKWIMSLAVGNKIEFFSSSNLINWTKESEFGENPMEGSHGGVWECPDLMPLNVDIGDNLTIEQWVLLVSINPGGPNGGSATQYFIGNLTADKAGSITFKTNPWKTSQWLDKGPDNYAGVTFSNEPSGRFIYIGWMSNWLYANFTPTSSWRGQMTIPRQLSLRVLDHSKKQYRLVSTPIKELEALRNQLQYIESTEESKLEAQSRYSLTEDADFRTPLMEVEVTLEINNEPHFAICASNSINEQVCFGLNQTYWYLDRSKSGNVGFSTEYANTLHAVTGTREITDKEINIRIFLDVSSIEIFADSGLTTMTALVYPTEPLNQLHIQNLSPANTKSSIKIKSFKVWGLLCWFTDSADAKLENGGAKIIIMNVFPILLIPLVFLFK